MQPVRKDALLLFYYHLNYKNLFNMLKIAWLGIMCLIYFEYIQWVTLNSFSPFYAVIWASLGVNIFLKFENLGKNNL